MKLDDYETPDGEALLRASAERGSLRSARGHELATNSTTAAVFLVASILLAALAPWHGSLSPLLLVLGLGTYITAEQVRFPVAGGFTYPTMLAFVPMLFVLPTPVVPLVAMLAILLGGAPAFLRRRTRVTLLPAYVADAWFAFGPALVIVIGGAQRFAWSHWPVYVAALGAQIVCDMASSIGRCWIGEGIDPRVQLPLMGWLYLVDAMLAPIGLLIAAAAVDLPGLMLLALPLVGLLSLLARERQQRLDQTLALSAAYRGTALLLADVVEADDHYTGVHSRDVVELSRRVAEQLGLDAAERQAVEFAALLHDVGKIRVPKGIINKPGKLDPDEWEVIRHHTIAGEQMLNQVGGRLSSVGRFVRASHEHFDGHGYPDGLIGEQIPIESRIVSVCDAYCAMTTNRPYRRAMPSSEVWAELHRCAGTQFDPHVVANLELLMH